METATGVNITILGDAYVKIKLLDTVFVNNVLVVEFIVDGRN